jgi:mannose/cellobiose epimerase-like protein (N-acyl-D-glucosamine 2-epimerase family)
VLRFYYPECIDTRFGGYIAQLDEQTGHVYDAEAKHLVATARAVHNFSVGTILDGPVWCRNAAEHGLQFLSTVHWDEDMNGYDWILSGRETETARRYCYGHAFVVLAAARAVQAEIPGARSELERAIGVIDRHFWEPEHGLYADQASADWSTLDDYRGQNANMHTCEAFIAAYEATDDPAYLDRAYTIAESFVRETADQTEGYLWEHYTTDWRADLSYNRDQPEHQFRPWGYQPGHHVEWVKLLLLLDRYRSEPWLQRRARELFEMATDWWDDEHGGFYYTVDESGDPVVADKYSWPVTEAIGATALLSQLDSEYEEWYRRLWSYAADHFVSSRHGNWYERLTAEHERDGPNRGIEVEPGYHPINNAWVAMRAFRAD